MCGMFGGGGGQTTIQWMAASRVDRDVKYFTFDRENLTHEQKHLAELRNSISITLNIESF